MAAGLIIIPNYMPALDSNANALSGAKAYFYREGTTTLTDVYSDAALQTAHTNPVIASSSGKFPIIYGAADQTFTVQIRTSADVVLNTYESIYPVNSLSVPLNRVRANNDFPNPDFQLMDGSLLVEKWKEDFSGRRDEITVSGITWTTLADGRAEVTFVCADTDGLVDGEWIQADTAADAPIYQTILRVYSVVPNTSFKATLEYMSLVPSVSSGFTCQIVTRGDDTGAAGGAIGTSGLTKNIDDGTSGWPYYQVGDYESIRSQFKGCTRYLVFQKKTAGTEYIYVQAPTDALSLYSLRSRSLGCAVMPITSGGIAQAFILDGDTYTYGSRATEVSTRQWIEVSGTCSASPTLWREGVKFTGPSGAIFVLAEFMSDWGDGPLGDGAFVARKGYTIRTNNTVNSWAFEEVTTPAVADASLSYGFTIDVVQASNGVIGEKITALHGMVEGRSNTIRNQLGFKSAVTGQIQYGPILNAPVSSVGVNPGDLAYAWGVIRPRNGKFVCYSISSGSQAWFNVSFDHSEFEVGGQPS